MKGMCVEIKCQEMFENYEGTLKKKKKKKFSRTPAYINQPKI